MVIEFSVGNYKSFKDRVTLSMVAANLVSEDKRLDENNVFTQDKDLRLLKSAAIYGANASGKSNLISALKFMRKFILNSSKDTQADESIAVERFRLSRETVDQPSFFELVFVLDAKRYRYGFEVTNEGVVSEWLFYVPTIREAKLFERKNGKIDTATAFKEGKDLVDRTRGNALFLSVVAQFNGPLAKKILRWFRNLNVISGLDDTGLRLYTMKLLDDSNSREEVLKFVTRLDVGIDDIQLHKSPLTMPPTGDMPEELRTVLKALYGELQKMSPDKAAEQVSVLTSHRVVGANGESVGVESFDIDASESEGTKKIFSIAGPVLNTLQKGKVLVVDELDARLHPLITKAIIGLFNSNETNPHNAQLIFATHDTNLLNRRAFRRDQVWFAEKDRVGATHLYSLAEFKVRNDASFETDYIQGRYGAIPFVGSLNNLLGNAHE